MKHIILITFFLTAVLAVSSAVAMPIIDVGVEICSNDVTTEVYTRIEDGTPTGFLDPDGYSIQSLDVSGNVLSDRIFGIEFVIFSEPPQVVDCIPIFVALPYSIDVSKIVVLHDQKVIYDKNVLSCNKDGDCDSWENYASCKEDCPSGSADGYCDRIPDNICDSDCSTEADVDCIGGNGLPPPPPADGGWLENNKIIIMIVIIFILIIVTKVIGIW